MDQNEAPLLDALKAAESRGLHGFGAPGHNEGAMIPDGLRRLIGRAVFRADQLTPKGLDDRSERTHALQRAHELAAEAWGADFCRFVTGGSTQSLHTVISALVPPGGTLILAANAHKAEYSHVLAAGLDAAIVPARIDGEWDIEHLPDVADVERALDAHTQAHAVLVVNPSYYGVSGDLTAIVTLCRRRGLPLIVDAAWGGAYAFSDDLPRDALAQGADVAVFSIHKTMGALAQGSMIVANGGAVDLQRLWMAYELFETTSPSVPILATLDGTRRDHALRGGEMWAETLARAARAREGFSAIPGVRVFGAADLPAGAELDASKILLDVSALGVAGYALDDWLYEHARVSAGLSDGRHLLFIVAPGTSTADLDAAVAALRDIAGRLAGDPSLLPRAPALPRIDTLRFERVMDGPRALFAEAEHVPFDRAVGRIAAEVVAPAPPGVPRLVPGQLVTAEHVAWLTANVEAGMFLLDPTDPTERTVRVVR